MVFSVILLVVLIFLNGIFSASELAFLSLDKIKLKKDVENGNKKAININKILNNPSSFLSTIQIGITLAGFLASAFAAEHPRYSDSSCCDPCNLQSFPGKFIDAGTKGYFFDI